MRRACRCFALGNDFGSHAEAAASLSCFWRQHLLTTPLARELRDELR
jgi:hypothetical protein